MGADSSKFHFISNLFHSSKASDKEEILEIVKDAKSRSIIDSNTEDMIQGVFNISDLRISDIMIPRSQMITINTKTTLEQAVKVITEFGHSRYPVYLEDKDHIAGILMAKDLLPYTTGLKAKIDNIEPLLRPPVIVPESKRVDAMLKEFQQNRFHMAIVIDEFGGVCGLVTIEDILELIVGEIGDEYDTQEEFNDEEDGIIKKQENIYILDGRTSIDAFNEFFKYHLPEVDVDTVAGMVMHAVGHLPKVDETVSIGKFSFKVLKIAKRQIRQLELKVNNDIDEEQ